MNVGGNINVEYRVVTKLSIIKKFLYHIETKYKYIGCDFEVSPKWTKKEREQSTNLTIKNADALSHPSLCQITHFQLAWNNSNSIVIIMLNKEIHDYILDWLITTDIIQIWSNIMYDGKHILYNTDKLPKHYHDDMLMYKCANNNANSLLCQASL